MDLGQKTERRILRGKPFPKEFFFFAAEKDTFRVRDKSLGRYRKSLPKEGISLYNGSDYNMKKKTIRRSEDSNTTEEGEFMHEYFECRASVPWLR